MQYEIEGDSLPVLICKPEIGESLITQSGAMSWMTEGFEMQTSSRGGIGKVFGRLFSGESLFLNVYTAQKKGEIAFASGFPGSIRAFQISPEREIIVQKGAFLACTSEVELSVFFQKKIGAGFFGGEGFIMQKLSGSGTAFVEIDGYAKEYSLKPGEKMIIDTGYLAMMDATCQIDIQRIKGVQNIIFGGEGLFNTVVTGPGKILVQTHPLSKVAHSLLPFLPNKSSSSD
ncbi:MAG: TIGR00266 family protein [Treponemataceae bacterium]